MGKAARAAKASAKGGFNLLIGRTLSNIISAVGTILTIRLLTPQEYGLVAIAITSSGLLGLFADWGINSAVIKYLAQYREENRIWDIKSILSSALIFKSTLGLVLSLASILTADFLATSVFHIPKTKRLIQVASLTILGNSLITASQAAFAGFERMELRSLIMVCQATLKALLIPLFVILGHGALGAILGNTISLIIVSVIGIVIGYQVLYKKLSQQNENSSLTETLQSMLKYGLPLSISTILTNFLTRFYIFYVALYCSEIMIGNYRAATNFTVLITLCTIPISTALFPIFSKLDPKNDQKTLKIIFQSSVKYTAFLTIPVTMAVMLLSEPLVFTLFGKSYSQAPLFLALYVITYFFSAFGNLSLISLLNGLGKTMVTLKLNLLNMATGLSLGLLLIPKFGVLGLIAATLISKIPGLTFGLWWVKKNYNFTLDWLSSIEIFLVSGASAVITHLILLQLGFQNWIELIIGGVTFLAIYLVLNPLTGAIKEEDVNNLRKMQNEMSFLRYIFNPILNIMETIIVKKSS